MKPISAPLMIAAMGLLLTPPAQSQSSMHVGYCGIDGKEYSDLSLSPCNPNRTSNSGAANSNAAIVNSAGNIGVALHDWLNNQMRKAAEKRAFEAAVKQRLEQQRLEAERQHRVEEARRLNAMINYLQGHLKLGGTPHLELKLGDTAQTGYGICGLPGEATGGQRPGCPQQETVGLGLKLGNQAASPAVYSKTPDPVGPNSNATSADELHKLASNLTPEQAAEIFSKLPPAQQQAILERFAQQNSLSNEQQAAAPPARDSQVAENGHLALKIGASGGAPTTSVGTPSPSQTAEARAHVSDEHSGGVLAVRQQPATQYSAPSAPETTTAATRQLPSSEGNATSAVPDKGLASQQLNAISAQRPEGSLEAQSEKARLGFDTATTWGRGQAPDGAPLNGTTPAVPPQTSQGVTAPPPLARATTGATSIVQAAPINTNPIPSGPLVAAGATGTTMAAPRPNAGTRPLRTIETAKIYADGGLIVKDGEKLCGYVARKCRAIVMQNINPGASMRFMQGPATPKPLWLKAKSSSDPRYEGYIPADPTYSKARGAELAEAAKSIKACLDSADPNRRCYKLTEFLKGTTFTSLPQDERERLTKKFEGIDIEILVDKDGKPYVADADLLGIGCGERGPAVDLDDGLGTGMPSHRATLSDIQSLGLQNPPTHLAANHSPDCHPPSFPATALEKDQQSGECKASTIRTIDELRDMFQRTSIPWDPRWDNNPPCGALKSSPEAVNPGPSGTLTISNPTRLRPQEISTGVRLAEQTGARLVESEHVGAEFVDAAGKTYDAMGGGKPFDAKNFGNGAQFMESIVNHVNKSVDLVAIDLRGASKEQISAIKNFVNTLTKKQQNMIIYVR